ACDGDGYGVVARVADADFQGTETGALEADLGPAVKGHFGRAGAIGKNLDVPPMDTADAGAEGFGNRLLGGETSGQLWRAAAAVSLLSLGVDAPQETLAKALHGLPYALDLDDVDA